MHEQCRRCELQLLLAQMFGPLIPPSKRSASSLSFASKDIGLASSQHSYVAKGKIYQQRARGRAVCWGCFAALICASIRNQLAFLAKADRACSGKVSSPAARS